MSAVCLSLHAKPENLNTLKLKDPLDFIRAIILRSEFFTICSSKVAELEQVFSMAEFQTMALTAGDMTKVLQAFPEGSIYFVIRKLKPSHVADDTTSSKCTLMIPVRFVEEHSDKFQRVMKLRSGVCTELTKVRLNIYNRFARPPEVLLGRGYKAFAARNELMVGDSLIFELKGVSEFQVYVFRGASAGSSPGTCNPNNAGEDGLSGWAAKKRKAGGEFEEQEVSMSLEMNRHDSENSLKMPFHEDDNAGSVKAEECQESKPSLPSFIQRLEVCHVQDSAGNTCGACLEIPFGFVKTLPSSDEDAHVKLQGIQEDSPVRTVTCAYRITQRDMEEFKRATRTMSALSLGWGDFVRENDLRAGQELVFTLAAASFFIVREVH